MNLQFYGLSRRHKCHSKWFVVGEQCSLMAEKTYLVISVELFRPVIPAMLVIGACELKKVSVKNK